MTDFAPSWPDIIREAIRQSLDGAMTSLPGKVVSYNATLQTAVIESAVVLDPPIPLLEDVPIAHVGSSDAFLHFKIPAGTSGLIFFSMRDFSGWGLSGSPSEPQLTRVHGLYAVFLPGLRPLSKPRVLLGQSGADIVLGTDTGARMALTASDGVEIQQTPIPNPMSLAAPLIRSGPDGFDGWAQIIEGAIMAIPGGGGATPAGAAATLRTAGFHKTKALKSE